MLKPIESVIRSKPITPDSARGDWTGESARAKFRGAAESDKSHKRAFGRCVRR